MSLKIDESNNLKLSIDLSVYSNNILKDRYRYVFSVSRFSNKGGEENVILSSDS